MSNSILPAAGNLDIVNAKVRADKFEATTSIGVSNTNPDFDLSVGTRFHVDKDSVDPVSVTGNVVASGIKISNLTIGPAFDFASVSNVGNVTANVIQFANATTGFTTTANVEIGGNITLTSNAQVKVGSNVLAEYTGPHPREPKEMPLKKFPEIAFDASKLDGNDTTNTYTQAGYTVTASSQASNDQRNPWSAFDDKDLTHQEFNYDVHLYNGGTVTNPGFATTNAALTTNVDGSGTYRGEWLQIEVPNKIKLNRYVLGKRANGITGIITKEGKILGSNDGTNWTTVYDHNDTGGVYSTSTTVVEKRNFQVNSSSYYKYFRLATNKLFPIGLAANNTMTPNIAEWSLYGYEEPAPPGDLSLDTTLKSTFNSVRSNNYVMYFDGEDPAAGNVPKNLVNDSSISITPHNAVFDATNNCWTLNGSTESNVTTGSLGFEGDAPHTVSTWINASNLEANALTQQIFSIGSGYDKAFLKVDDTQIAANTWHNVTYAYQGEGGSKVTYVDGRKVAEAQVEDTFGDYPPFDMTGYSQGGYVASAVEEYDANYNAWEAFDGDTNTSSGTGYWSSKAAAFAVSSPYATLRSGGVFVTNVGGTNRTGLWIQLELPHRLKVGYITWQPREASGMPRAGFVVGSNNGITWEQIYEFAGVTGTTGLQNPILASGSISRIAYKYIRIVVTNGGGNQYVNAQQVGIYGHKEGDLTRFPEPTRVLKYPHVAMTGPAQRGYVASASSTQTGVREAWNAFDGDVVMEWRSSGADYTGSDGIYIGTAHRLAATDTDGAAIPYGEWLQIKMPNKILLQSIKLVGDTNFLNKTPEDFKLYGSINGSTWKLLITQTGLTPTNGGNIISPASALSVRYDYYALVTTKLFDANQTDVAIEALEFYGTEENTGTPAIVGGPFAGKVANFRVYDQYLGDERIQEIYDAQKDEFGHKKSSMTLYKGRIGVGTTEPEGSLTVLDEPHALAKFPARVVPANDSYVEGNGRIKLSAADGSGYQAFDGLTSTSWTAKPTRNTRVSEEVDFGAWLKIQTPESMSLKKAEIESNPYWNQVGSETYGGSIDNITSGDHFGRAVACSHDGTRVIVGAYVHSGNQGKVKVYDWNGSSWTLVGSTLTGTADNDLFGHAVAISGNGNIIAVAAPREHHATGNVSDVGTVRVYSLVGATWTILPDSGTLTADTSSGMSDVFVGETAEDRLGQGGVKLSYDGYTVAMGEAKDDTGVANIGRIRVFTYSNGAWSQKGSTLLGDYTEEEFGQGLDMSEDGNHLIIGTKFQGGTSQPPRVEVYQWNGTDTWIQKGSSLTYADTGDGFGPSVSISNDGNTIAIGIKNADIAEGAPADNAGAVYVYHWSGSAWGTPHTLIQPVTDDDDFGDHHVMSGDGKRIIVGASHADDGGTNSGRLYTFEYTGVSWVRREVPSVGADGGTNAYLGMGPSNSAWSHAISRDGSVIVAGESGFYTNGAAYSGRVRIYNMPSTIKSIWGSNDDVNWTKITTAHTREEATSNVAGLAFGYDDRLEFKNLDNPNYYKYHAIVADAFTRLKDVKLFGIRNQGSSTLHDGALTLTKNLDVPRIGPPLDADDTPRRDRLVVEYNTSTNPVEDGFVQDTSGRGLDGALSGGASYDATQKALVFDGTTDYIMGRLGNAGDIDFTVSLWVKKNTSGTVGMLWNFGGSGGTGNPEDSVALEVGSGNNLDYFIFSGAQGAITNFGTNYAGKWVHVVATRSGNNLKIYFDGVDQNMSITGTDTLQLAPNSEFTIGARGTGALGNNSLNGSISNFKIYDVVLTAEEVKTLYDMGRCDEGGHMVNFSKTRVGIGLGDGALGDGAYGYPSALTIRGNQEVKGDIILKDASSELIFNHSSIAKWKIRHNGGNNSGGELRFDHWYYNGGIYQWNERGYLQWNGTAQMNFTGQHRTFIKDVPFSQAGDLEGLIVSSDQNKYIKMSGGIEAGSNAITMNESLPVVSLSTTTNDKKCFGVISASEDPEERGDAFGNFVSVTEKEKGDTRVYINSVGEGAIWVVNTNGSLESGDYITTSNVAGYGQKQESEFLANYTVAKITMDCDFNPATQPVQVIRKDDNEENVLDEHGQIQWEDHATETEKAYKIRYLDTDGNITDEANAVHTAAFVGCTYHCG